MNDAQFLANALIASFIDPLIFEHLEQAVCIDSSRAVTVDSLQESASIFETSRHAVLYGAPIKFDATFALVTPRVSRSTLSFNDARFFVLGLAQNTCEEELVAPLISLSTVTEEEKELELFALALQVSSFVAKMGPLPIKSQAVLSNSAVEDAHTHSVTEEKKGLISAKHPSAKVETANSNALNNQATGDHSKEIIAPTNIFEEMKTADKNGKRSLIPVLFLIG